MTTNPIVGQITKLIAIGTCFSLILVFTLLPSILNLKERVTRAYYIKKGKGDPDEGKDNVPIYEKKRQAKLAAKKLAMSAAGTGGETVVSDSEPCDGVKGSDIPYIGSMDEVPATDAAEPARTDIPESDASDEVMTTEDDAKDGSEK